MKTFYNVIINSFFIKTNTHVCVFTHKDILLKKTILSNRWRNYCLDRDKIKGDTSVEMFAYS